MPAHAAQNALTVDQSGRGTHATISEALATADIDTVIRIAPGTYRERLRVDLPVSIRAQQPGTVEVIVDTDEPYAHALACGAGRVEVSGLTFRHRSKSVANNYAVLVEQGGALSLRGCVICSSSGSGVGVDGGALEMEECDVQDCQLHGLAVFGSLEGGGGGACSVRRCAIARNGLDGVLVRAGAAPTLTDNVIADNGQWGIELIDCGGSYAGNRVSGNRKGSMALDAAILELDAEQLQRDNQLDRAVTFA